MKCMINSIIFYNKVIFRTDKNVSETERSCS